nr:ribosome biogenesis protein NOP53-like [Arachis hypogaea]
MPAASSSSPSSFISLFGLWFIFLLFFLLGFHLFTKGLFCPSALHLHFWPIKTKRVTRVELNKRLRHKEQQKKEAEAKKLEDLSKEIDSIPEITEEIKQEDEEKQKNMLR